MSVLLPYVVTPVAVTLIFSSAFDEKYGLINNLLQSFHLGPPITGRPRRSPRHVAIATMVNWRWTGYNALILLAAMQAIPRDIYESAALDGAGALPPLLLDHPPELRPTMIFVIITATIGGLQIFTEPKLFNPSSAMPGGPQRQYQTTVLYLWDMAFNRSNFGKASAIAWLLFLIIVHLRRAQLLDLAAHRLDRDPDAQEAHGAKLANHKAGSGDESDDSDSDDTRADGTDAQTEGGLALAAASEEKRS